MTVPGPKMAGGAETVPILNCAAAPVRNERLNFQGNGSSQRDCEFCGLIGLYRYGARAQVSIVATIEARLVPVLHIDECKGYRVVSRYRSGGATDRENDVHTGLEVPERSAPRTREGPGG